MAGITAFTFALNLLYFIITVWMVFFVLRRLDKSLGVTFKDDVLVPLLAGNLAPAIYFGARFLGVCILAAAFLR